MADREIIVEGNKLIAEFMGYTNNFWYQNNELEYHSSWSKLMPAWSKFYNEIILSEWYKDYYTKESNTDLDCMEYSLTCVHIQGAFKHFTNLLKWYNIQVSERNPLIA